MEVKVLELIELVANACFDGQFVIRRDSDGWRVGLGAETHGTPMGEPGPTLKAATMNAMRGAFPWEKRPGWQSNAQK